MVVKQKKIAPLKALKPIKNPPPVKKIQVVKPLQTVKKSKPVTKQNPSYNVYNQKPAGKPKQKSKVMPNKPVGSARKRYIIKFCAIVGGIVGSFLLLVTVAALGYLKMTPDGARVEASTPDASGSVVAESTVETEQKGGDEKKPNVFLPPRKTNFLIMGLDETEALADVIVVGCFDRETKKIDLISIPRDTYIQMSKEQIKALQDAGRTPPYSGIMKMNAVHSYAGKELGAKYQKEILEKLLGIKIDYYAEVDLDAFKSIVETVGGVEMTIPDGGLHYYDPTQNLSINVPGGTQILDAKAAEGVVRYRATYARGDLQRIEVQQDFMKQLFKEVLNKDTIMKNAISFLSTIMQYVKTDFNILDAPKYVRYANDLSVDNLSMHMLPGEARTIDGASYYIHDTAETSGLVDQIFYSTETEADTDATQKDTVQDNLDALKKLRIQILNGGQTAGMATKKRDELKKDGFNVINVGNYAGTKKNETRIMVREGYDVKELEHFFTNVVVEKDSNVTIGYDIVIIMGIDG